MLSNNQIVNLPISLMLFKKLEGQPQFKNSKQMMIHLHSINQYQSLLLKNHNLKIRLILITLTKTYQNHRFLKKMILLILEPLSKNRNRYQTLLILQFNKSKYLIHQTLEVFQHHKHNSKILAEQFLILHPKLFLKQFNLLLYKHLHKLLNLQNLLTNLQIKRRSCLIFQI